jgi:hypothetical protein
MLRQIASAVVAFMLTLAVGAAAWADCVDEQTAQVQMKCCAAMHHQCGRGNADDCCNKMKDASPSSNVATPAIARVTVRSMFLAVGVLPADASAPCPTNAGSMDVTIVRPHDPPHLHTFPLLI